MPAKIGMNFVSSRSKGIPVQTISNAAMNAGAISTYLSGSGPTISAVSLNKEVTINYEMLDAANKLGLEGKGFISSISDKGAYIVE